MLNLEGACIIGYTLRWFHRGLPSAGMPSRSVHIDVSSAAAEDSPDPRDDGPVVASALARIRGDQVQEVVLLPTLGGGVIKVEGLMVLDADERQTTLFAVTDVDDPDAASWATTLRVRH